VADTGEHPEAVRSLAQPADRDAPLGAQIGIAAREAAVERPFLPIRGAQLGLGGGAGGGFVWRSSSTGSPVPTSMRRRTPRSKSRHHAMQRL